MLHQTHLTRDRQADGLRVSVREGLSADARGGAGDQRGQVCEVAVVCHPSPSRLPTDRAPANRPAGVRGQRGGGSHKRVRDCTITAVRALDVRFPTSRTLAGSDAMNAAPDYSAAYVILETDSDLRGYGMTFTIGRGTEVVMAAVAALSPLVEGRRLADLAGDQRASGARWPANPSCAGSAPRRAHPPRHGRRGQRRVGPVGPGRGQAGVEARDRHDSARARRLRGLPHHDRCAHARPGRGPPRRARARQGRAGGADPRRRSSPPTRRRRVGSGTATRRSARACRAAVEEGWTHVKMKVGGRAGRRRAPRGDDPRRDRPRTTPDDGRQSGVGRG